MAPERIQTRDMTVPGPVALPERQQAGKAVYRRPGSAFRAVSADLH
jgi:hypothetical protein